MPRLGGARRRRDPARRSAERALSFAQVDAIVGRFQALSPYDPTVVPGSVLKIEEINFDKKRRRRQLYAYAISAKRYCLYTLNSRGEPVIVKYSEHGLGHLLNPLDPEDPDRAWIKQVWHYLLCQAVDIPVEEPA